MNAPENPSEIARIRSQIAAEYEAAHRALHGLASGTACHSFINARMERIGVHVSALAEIVGSEDAAAILAEALEGGSVELRC